ncbi:hypothetical protein F4810DRAFT_468728 [Camillea tinctor]|nr:hypothetical protein F4810DRAFT_468728 [Camillea tinctor]
MLANAMLAAALVSTASAHLPAIARRDFLESRQDLADTSEECQSAVVDALPLFQELPTPSDELLSITESADPCATDIFTGSLSADLSSFSSELLAWSSSNSDVLSSLFSVCPELTSFESEEPICTSAAAGASATTGVSATTTEAGKTTATPGSSSASPSNTSGSTLASATSGSATSTSGSSSSSTAVPTANAAPRETGLVMVAAAAAAGLMGAIAVL